MLVADVPLALTFDDVLLVPRHSTVLPREVNTSTRLGSLSLNIPLLSAAMDTVTESGTAIAIARQGGIGIVHKNMSVDAQAHHVRQVKRAVTGTVTNPVTVQPDVTLREARRIMRRQRRGSRRPPQGWPSRNRSSTRTRVRGSVANSRAAARSMRLESAAGSSA